MSWESLNHFLENYLHHVWAGVISLVLAALFIFSPGSIRQSIWQALFTEQNLSQRYLAGMLFFFSLLVLSLLWSGGERLDAWVFYNFNWRGARPPWLDRLMWLITQSGNGFLALLCAVYFWQQGERRLANQMALGSLTLWLVVELVKALVRRPRPFVRLAQTRIVGLRAVGRSFPSGHTGQAFFQSTLLVLFFHPSAPATALVYLGAVLVGVTRMYVGAHYPRDVLAGAVLGTIFGFIAILI